MSKVFSKGGLLKTDPFPEFKIDKVIYGDGSTYFQVMDHVVAGGYVPRGREFKSLKGAKSYLNRVLARKRASQVDSREQVYP